MTGTGPLFGTANFSLDEAERASASAWPLTDLQAAHAQLSLEADERVRAWLGGGRLILSSLVRSAEFNAELENAALHSPHLTGDGSDLVPEDSTVLPNAAEILAPYSPQFAGAGIDRIIISSDHLHVAIAPDGGGAGVLLIENPDGSFTDVSSPAAAAASAAPSSGSSPASSLALLVLMLVLVFAAILGAALYFTRR